MVEDSGKGSLRGRRVALPESRELDLLARMLADRGAEPVPCPLVSIRDNPDREPVLAWIDRLLGGELDHLVLFTGEGLRRLLAVATERGQQRELVAALARIPVTARGPKPVRELRRIGLQPDHAPQEATTAGLIHSLSALGLNGRRVGVQLYGAEPNEPFMAFLREAGAEPDPVAPYVYASEAEDRRVAELLDELEGGQLDSIAFTSSQQVRRLFQVAGRAGRKEGLVAALLETPVAAVGPVVAEALSERGVPPAITPQGSYFMKPLVRALESELGGFG